MIINHKHKFIFIHIPRTGGTSTLKALQGLEGSVVYDKWCKSTRIGQHNTLTDYAKRIGIKNVGSYFKWTRVRNPWDRLVSIYNRLRALRELESPFGDWLDMQMLDTLPPWRRNIFKQKRFIKDQGLDFVARFENINEDFSFFCDKVGLPQTKLPHENYHEHNDYREYYNKKLTDKLLGFDDFREDLDYLKYDYKP